MQNNFDKIIIPDKLNTVVNESLTLIQKKHKKIVMHKVVIALSSTAAVFVIIVLFGMANPVLASNWPIIGHIFEQVEENVSYKGDFSSLSEQPLTNTDIENSEESNEMDSVISQTSNGITVTISEVYYNSKALYLGVSIKNQEEFPKDFKKTENMEDYSLDYDFLGLRAIGKLSFWDQYVSPYRIEGKFSDMNTFIGIIRIDIGHISQWPTDEEIKNAGIDVDNIGEDYLDKVKEKFPYAGNHIEVPEQFSYDIRLNKIYADLFETVAKEYTDPDGEKVVFNEAVKKEYEGEWNFHLDVKLDESQTQVRNINTTNDSGIGIAKIEKTPYEITVDEIMPSEEMKNNCYIAICDANGDLFDYQAEYADTYQVYGRDTSTVSVFICDYDNYMDHLKGYYYSEDYDKKKETKTFAQYLNENCLYSTVVNFVE